MVKVPGRVGKKDISYSMRWPHAVRQERGTAGTVLRRPPTKFELAEKRWGQLNVQIAPIVRKMQNHQPITAKEKAEHKRLSAELAKVQRIYMHGP